MPANARIVATNYNPPRRDAQGEHVVTRNIETRPLDLTDWTLHDIIPMRPVAFHIKAGRKALT